jgi:hypothetical protein
MDFWAFPNFKNGKNPNLTRIFISSEPQLYIYAWLLLAELIPNHKTVSPDSIPSSRNCSPKFEAVSTTASNYSQSMHRLWNLRIPLRSSRRGLHRSAFDSSIEPPNRHQSTVFFSAPARVFFPDEKPPLLSLGFLCVLRFPVRAGPPSSITPDFRRQTECKPCTCQDQKLMYTVIT